MNEENLSVSSDDINENDSTLDPLESSEEENLGENKEDTLQKENEILKTEIDSLKDKILRISAEYDNYRKRSVKEKTDLYGDTCAEIISQVLPILDNLERANSVDSDLDSLKQGINMVIKLFYSILEKMDVKEIDSEGEFNPNLHEAVMHVNDENLGKNSIVEVLQKGYIRNDKVIRHSMVKVAN